MFFSKQWDPQVKSGMFFSLICLIILYIFTWNWGMQSKHDIDTCLISCSPHQGLALIYYDDDCKCNNGLVINPENYKTNGNEE